MTPICKEMTTTTRMTKFTDSVRFAVKRKIFEQNNGLVTISNRGIFKPLFCPSY